MKIRYITGRGGSLDRGLSQHLASLTSDYAGLAVDSALLSLPIGQQLERVRELSQSAAGGHLIVSSYGGYLLMLSLIDAAHAPERVLMLSPLFGRSIFRESFFASRPPREPVLCVLAICVLLPVAMTLSAVLSWRSRWPTSYRLIKSMSLTDKSMIWRPRVCSWFCRNFWLVGD